MAPKALFCTVLIASSLAVAGAQTRITPPDNKYTPAQDVQLGRDAAREARQQLPLMRDAQVASYVRSLGERLVRVAPTDLQHPEFQYSFETVNIRDINAFALPGGPMFVNRGMIEAAQTEGEVAGVVAHELSHVLLRHGTAQASKATKYELGQLAGVIAGAVIGGRVGSMVAQGTQFGLGAAFMRYGREYEKQADLLGAQIMARAGYDPREMANMFKTIEKEGGAGGPEWLSDHPNPGNRSAYIQQEARSLRVANAVRDTVDFSRVKSYLRSLPRAPSSEEVAKNTRTSGGGPAPAPRDTGRVTERVEAPSSRYVPYSEGDMFTVRVPENWRELGGSSAVTFAPEGGYGDYRGQNVFTHGIEFGIIRNEGHPLQEATSELIESLREANPRLSRPSPMRRTTVGGVTSLQTALSNISDVTGREERIQVTTTDLRNGMLFYAVAVAPEDEARAYQGVFERVLNSIQFTR